MVSFIKNLLFRGIPIALAAYLLFAIVGTILPHLSSRQVSQKQREKLDAAEYLSPGNTAGPDSACLLETPEDAYAARVAMLRGAQHSLVIVNHVVKPGQTSEAFFGEVLAAARRGVEVTILLDGVVSIASPPNKIISSLNALNNVNCFYYNPPGVFTPWKWQAFLHDKIMIADEQWLMLGGRNIDERHFNPQGFRGPITHDRDVLVFKNTNNTAIPSSVDQCQKYVLDLLVSKPVRSAKMQTKCQTTASLFGRLQSAARLFEKENPCFYTKSLDDFRLAMVPTNKITLLAGPTHAYKKEPWVGYSLRRILHSASQSVVIQTPYATANPLFLQALQQAAQKADVALLTNSMASSPNFPAFSSYHYQRPKFLQTGAQLYEYQHTDSIHGKSIVVDSRLSAVGSFNMDDRSLYIDTETMLVIDSPAFAQKLTEAMNQYISQSLPVAQNNSYAQGPVSALPVSGGKRALMRLTYFLLKPFRFLL